MASLNCKRGQHRFKTVGKRSLVCRDCPKTRPVRLSACGTRAVERHGPGDFRAVCATCGAGGSVRHRTRESATTAAVRDSARPCQACGAS